MEPRVYEPSDGTRIVAHVVYGLHTVSILLGLMTGAPSSFRGLPFWQ